MSDLKQAIKLIGENARAAHFSGPKCEELVREAEAALGLIFPPTYRAFLLHLGCGTVASEEFYGIPKSELRSQSVPNGIWLTLSQRKAANLPQSLIVIADNGVGGWYVIDTSKENAEGDSPVLDWWSNNLQSQVVADDFGAFLLQRVCQVLR